MSLFLCVSEGLCVSSAVGMCVRFFVCGSLMSLLCSSCQPPGTDTGDKPRVLAWDVDSQGGFGGCC